MRNAGMVMERTAERKAGDKASNSAIGAIVFHVHNDTALNSRLEAALSLARAFEAHLKLLHVTPIDAYTVVDAFGTFTSREIIDELEAEAAKLRRRLESKLSEEDVSWDYEEVTGSLMPHLAQRGALADLLVIGRESKSPEFERSAMTLLGELLHHLGTPLLVLGDELVGIDPTGGAVVAWNGSQEAANALRASVPLLGRASDVVLLTIEERDSAQIPAEEARKYLLRHGIESKLVSRPRMARSIAGDIVDAAIADGASWIVAGGYGHSRAGELLFGGVTRSLLRECALPLLISR